jgi:hypothetical protein
MTEARPYHVLIELSRARFYTRLREIEAWLAEWQIDAEIGSVLAEAGQLRVRFADERAAYAFLRCHAGRSVPADEIKAARLGDVADENRYERLALEYPD